MRNLEGNTPMVKNSLEQHNAPLQKTRGRQYRRPHSRQSALVTGNPTESVWLQVIQKRWAEEDREEEPGSSASYLDSLMEIVARHGVTVWSMGRGNSQL
jgi:hypothetical protein